MNDFLDQFNLIDRIEGIVWGLFTWLPHRRTRKGRKVGGLRIDGGTREIRVDRRHTSGAEAERTLRAAHIPVAGRRVLEKEAIFLVKTRQAKWAEYVLLRAGVKLAAGHQVIDPRNIKYTAGRGPVQLWK